MTERVEFLAWSRGGEAASELKSALSAFEKDHPQIKVSVALPEPAMMWSEIVKAALYGQAADIGEVGSTYVESLKGMNSLRPFTSEEVALLGGNDAFAKSCWQGGLLSEEKQTWAIPWRTDSRVIFYRRDLFAKAGIDEKDAFRSPSKMEETLQALKDNGVEVPLTMGTASPQVLTLFAASWIWESGGDFIHPERNQVIFDSPEAREGLRNYFRLGCYLVPQARKLAIGASDHLFCHGRAAVTYTGTWLPDAIEQLGDPVVKHKRNLGAALVPGVPVVGGTNLVIWRHTKKEKKAFEVIRFLNSTEALTAYPKCIVIPAKNEALDNKVFANSLAQKIFVEAVKTGRSLPAVSLWAMVEDRLGKTLMQIWDHLDKQPDADLDNVIAKFINPLAARLNAALASEDSPAKA